MKRKGNILTSELLSLLGVVFLIVGMVGSTVKSYTQDLTKDILETTPKITLPKINKEEKKEKEFTNNLILHP